MMIWRRAFEPFEPHVTLAQMAVMLSNGIRRISRDNTRAI
jgi:hypothetical protein